MEQVCFFPHAALLSFKFHLNYWWSCNKAFLCYTLFRSRKWCFMVNFWTHSNKINTLAVLSKKVNNLKEWIFLFSYCLENVMCWNHEYKYKSKGRKWSAKCTIENTVPGLPGYWKDLHFDTFRFCFSSSILRIQLIMEQDEAPPKMVEQIVFGTRATFLS